MKEMNEVTMIYAIPSYVECPYCGEHQDGWVGDPRGSVEICEDCNRAYKVSNYADVDIP